MAGGTATILHHIFQKTGMTPDEFYEKPPGVRAFLIQSMKIALVPPGRVEVKKDE